MDEIGALLSAALGQATGDGSVQPPPWLVAISGWLQEHFGFALPLRLDDPDND